MFSTEIFSLAFKTGSKYILKAKVNCFSTSDSDKKPITWQRLGSYFMFPDAVTSAWKTRLEGFARKLLGDDVKAELKMLSLDTPVFYREQVKVWQKPESRALDKC